MHDSLQHRVGSYRWIICALLFFATTINYTDRAVLGVLEPELRNTIGWDGTQYGLINAAFMIAYAFGSLGAGWMMDAIGVRLGFSISLVVWSLTAAAHALAHNTSQFALARFALGLGESGNFPASIKTVTDWFPKKERALATGIFNAGSNMGAIMAPAVVPLLALYWGWHAAFIATGVTGLIWVLFWWPLYRQPEQHPSVTPSELVYIRSDPADPIEKMRWRDLLPYRQTWAFAIAKFLTDPVWWFYLFWFSPFMNDRFGINLKSIGGPMVTVYVLATIGSIVGGWFSSALLNRGWSTNAARKTALLICALCVVPVSLATQVDRSQPWIAVILVGVAAAAHQAFSANLYTLTSDMFPRQAIGSVVGIGTFAGAMCGAAVQLLAGRLKDITGNYTVMFMIAGSAYIVALLIFHLMVPRLEPVEIEAKASVH
ncbi:MAG TPA: MFS transporter [Lacipirellulaceae bacterium]|nr:MFS transporter [Lacipirellulaceae bacterium]